METNAPSSRPSFELNMSLLGGSSAPPAKKARENDEPTTVMRQEEQESPMPSPQPAPLAHEDLLKESMQWIRELETVRDDLHMLSVRNAILLDSLAMAGATEILSGDEEEENDE